MRLGIVGTGRMASEVARAATHVPGLEVSAVLSRSADRAREFCDRFAPKAQAEQDMDAFLRAVDAVYVATPPDSHASCLNGAISRKVPVLCEKPLAPSASACRDVLSRAQGEGVLVMEAIWTLALPAYRALRDLVREKGGLGVGTQLFFDFSMPLIAAEDAHYFSPRQGGVLLDRAVYGYAAAISVNGPVRHQQAHVTRRADGLDTSADLRLTHEEGGTSFITLSFDRLGPNRLDVATGQGLAGVGPGSLACEVLSWKAADRSAPIAGHGEGGGLKARLRSMSLLRAIKARAPAGGRFMGYGASRFCPILIEFMRAVESGKAESDLVPHALSQSIADLTQAARQVAECTGGDGALE
ncbi:Gfo/Idh/MocA family oxidoreductase [Defluviimonas sp. WL0002]|uniref:Gfo/Idh/MocA family oxidoreductase n=1 Tax=Albidovulum marisflavi TaxID=2984159 RepID=A0ABT2ZCN5_9RHOB|nr:Gfo/Idh/MocA family oxidoreductase [Defluviimonas sp. WL0002]MCV2868905.1 Gfo/Idh/MocA family oxidoreductase [Defluviimonas sp. WL0002]